MEKSNFDQLLSRYLEGNVTEAERRKLETWLELRKTENTTDVDLSPEAEEQLFQKIISKDPNLTEVTSPHPGKRRIIQFPVLAIAATVLLLIVAGFAVWKYSPAPVFTTTGQSNKLILADGTLVWLQDASKLSFSVKPDGTRSANLDGDALFEVAKDPVHPFVIQCGAVSIRVTGTSFHIRRTDTQVEVNVLTGHVYVADATTGVEVKANEKVIYQGSAKFTTGIVRKNEIEQLTSGTEYAMVFSDETLPKVLERVAAKFNTSIRIEGERLDQCRITADFTDQSLDATLEMISEVLGIQVLKSEKEVVVRGKSCH